MATDTLLESPPASPKQLQEVCPEEALVIVQQYHKRRGSVMPVNFEHTQSFDFFLRQRGFQRRVSSLLW